MRRLLVALLACSAAAAVARTAFVDSGRVRAAPAQFAYPDWLRPCTVPAVAAPALCGTYEVWENRAARSGRRIPLHLIVLPVRGSVRRADPIFYLAGGPGGAASVSAALLQQVLAAAHRERDIILVDVRGTGRSAGLQCPAPDRNAPAQDYFRSQFDTAHVRRCRGLHDVDVAQYHTTSAMADLDEVRAALGLGQINLFGISGGTRAAQVYLRHYERNVRTAVLKGVVPMDFEMPLPFARAMEHGVRGLLDACATDRACSTAYPNLAADWKRVLERFERGAVDAEVVHPVTGRTERVRIDRGVFADGVRHLLYNVAQASRLPGIIHAAAVGDFRSFAQFELAQASAFQRQIAYGMFLSSTCIEDVPFATEAEIRSASQGTFLGDYRVRAQQAACSAWLPGVRPDPAFQQPVTAKVPVLLISGQFDTATPPDAAERVAARMPNSRHIVFPNQSHDFANFACESRLIAHFIERGDARFLDVACVAQTRRPPFDTTTVR